MTVDMIHHPPHYSAARFGVECIEFTRHMTFTAGNAFKYIWRAEEKGTLLQDLGKALVYLHWAEAEAYPALLSLRGTEERIRHLIVAHLIPKERTYWEITPLLAILDSEFLEAAELLQRRHPVLEVRS